MINKLISHLWKCKLAKKLREKQGKISFKSLNKELCSFIDLAIFSEDDFHSTNI